MTMDAGPPRVAGRPPHLARGLVRMYPRPWRVRYGEELVDLLNAGPLTILVVGDVVRGALDAHLHRADAVGGWSGVPARVRSATATVLAAWVMFFFAAAVVGRTTNDSRFDDVAYAHPLIAAARWLATAALLGSVVVVACAALPLVAVAAWQAWWRRDPMALALFAAPAAGLALFVGYTALLIQLPEQPVHSVGYVVVTASWFALAVAVAEVAGVGVAAAQMRRTDFPPPLLRLAGWVAAVAAGAMSVGLLAGAAYGLGIWIETPPLFFSSNGVFATPLPLTWAAMLLVAGAATTTAIPAALRGIRALRAA